MPGRVQVLPFPELKGGINRFEADALPTQATSALNACTRKGDMRRREAFVSLAAASPHHLPAGRCILKIFDPGLGSVLTPASRTIDLSSASYSFMYFGCTDSFDGVELHELTPDGAAGSEHQVFYMEYLVDETWTPVPFHLDTTRRFSSGGYLRPLLANGRLTWHATQLDGWVASEFDSDTAFWIRVSIRNLDGDTGTLPASVLAAPGARVLQMMPVNGLFPYQDRHGLRRLVIGSDRQVPRGLEEGAEIGCINSTAEEAKRVLYLEKGADEGPGFYGEKTWPNATTMGAAGVLTKLTQRYEWKPEELSPGVVKSGLVPAGTSTASQIDTGTINNAEENDFEHGILLVTTGGGGGPALGEYRQIAYSGETSGSTPLIVDEPFSAAPVAGTRFALLMPHLVMKFVSAGDQEFAVETNAAQTITPVLGRDFVAEPPNSPVEVHWEIGRPVRWGIRGGHRWSHVFDPVGNELLLTNGGPLLRFDGQRLRRYECAISTAAAIQIAGVSDTRTNLEIGAQPDPIVLDKLLRFPPAGKYLTDYGSRIVIAGLAGRPYDVQYSAPGAANNVWKAAYQATIRDPFNLPISGVAKLYNQLVVFTPGSIHVASPPNEQGLMSFQPAAYTGFSAHHAVCRIARQGTDALIGPNADGLKLWTGAEPVDVIDDWERILEGGVNLAALGNAVACAWQSQTRYLLAITPGGAYQNTRLVDFNWVTGATWLHSLPFGCSSLVVEVLPDGREVVLLGTDDGHIMTMIEGPTDDGSEIESHVRCAPFEILNGVEAVVSRFHFAAQQLGLGTLNVEMFVDAEDEALQSVELEVDIGDSQMGSGAMGSARMSRAGFVPQMLNLPAGVRATRVAYQVGGTEQWTVRKPALEVSPQGRRPR